MKDQNYSSERWPSRISVVFLLVFGALVFAPNCWAQQCPPAVEGLAKAYGLDSFGQIDAIRSTFNIDFPGLKISQSWIWEPKADRVTYEGKDKAGNPVRITYVRSQVSSQPDNVKNEIDPSFNNNQYWLFLPFHACWDTAAKVEDSGMHKLPRGVGSARRVVMRYPPDYEIAPEWDLCLASIMRPVAQERISKLMEQGFHKPGDVENRLGYHVGQLGR